MTLVFELFANNTYTFTFDSEIYPHPNIHGTGEIYLRHESGDTYDGDQRTGNGELDHWIFESSTDEHNFTPTVSGTYYFDVRHTPYNTPHYLGNYTLSSELTSVFLPNNHTLTSNLDNNTDNDYFQVSLEQGLSTHIRVTGDAVLKSKIRGFIFLDDNQVTTRCLRGEESWDICTW